MSGLRSAGSSLSVSLFLLLSPEALQALDLQGFEASVHNRFETWNPGEGVATPNRSLDFIGAGYDWSGVVWNNLTDLNSRALLTPRHSVGASHTYGMFPDATAVGADGQLRQILGSSSGEAVGQGFYVGGEYDLNLGTLSATHIPTGWGVATYAVLDLPTTAAYGGRAVLLYGHGNGSAVASPRIAPSTLNGLNTSGSSSSFSTWVTGNAGVELQGGDSGGPSFLPWTNPQGQKELTLVGTHSAVSTSFNYDNFIAKPAALAAMNALMVDEGFAVRHVADATTRWTGASGSYAASENWSASAANATSYIGWNATLSSVRIVNGGGMSHTARGFIFEPAAAPEAFVFENATWEVGRGGLVNHQSINQTFSASSSLRLADHQYWDARSGGFEIQGQVDLNGRLLVVQGEGDTRIQGAVQDSTAGGAGLSKYGTGTLLLESQASYAGTTWVYGGTLRLGSAANLPNSTRLLVANSADVELDLNGRSQQVALLNSLGGESPGRIHLGAGGRLLLVQGNGTGNSLFTGRLSGGTSGMDSVVVQGAVVQNTNTVKFGGASDYLGRTVVDGTFFSITSNSALGAAGAGNETIVNYRPQDSLSPGVSVTGSGRYDESLVLRLHGSANAGTSIFNFDATSIDWSSPVILSRNLTTSSATATWDIRSTTASGPVVFNGFQGELIAGAMAGSSNTLRLTSGNFMTLDGPISNGSLAGGGLRLDLRGTGTLQIKSASTHTGVTNINAANVIVSVDAFEGAPGAFGNASSTVTLGSFAVSNDVALLATNNATIARKIVVPSLTTRAVSLGTVAGGNATFSGSITLNRSVVLTSGEGGLVRFGGAILQGNGTTAIDLQGTGTLTLAGNNTFTGAVRLLSGTVDAQHSRAFGQSSSVDILGGVLNLPSAAPLLLGANTRFELNGGTLAFQPNALASGILASGGQFSLLSGAIHLDLSAPGFDASASYALFSGFDGTSQIGNILFTGHDAALFQPSLSASGLLSFTPVPEPRVIMLAAVALCFSLNFFQKKLTLRTVRSKAATLRDV